MRWLTIVLLLCVLPRITLAVQGTSIVCFSADRVEVGCHTTIVDTCCNTDHEPVPAPVAPEACVDLSSAPACSGPRVAVDAPHFAVAWLTILPVVLYETGDDLARPSLDLGNESPPRFAARVFATLTSPRS